MGFFDKLKGELIDIIEWTDSGDDVMVFRFERYGNEIKNGAKLTVRESQVAVFVNEGQLADVFPPGMYTLSTQNLPVMSTLKGWKYGFSSPFKAEVYFLNTKKFTNQKWGTPNVFYIRDTDFGRVSLRAFGTYTMKIVDPQKFMKEVVGTKEEFTTEEIQGELRSMIITRFIDSVGESKIALLDFAQNYKDLSDFCQQKLGTEFLEYGLEISKFLIQSINLPEELQKKLDEGTGMNMIGNMNTYSQMKAADAMQNAANNPGGSGGSIEGIMGMTVMQQMMNQQNQQNAQKQNVPPPPPPLTKYFVSLNGQQTGPFDMTTMRQMIMSNQITKQTYVWKEGMANWMFAEQVPEVLALFGAVPPPPPPM